jgi:hypothetical protein
MTPWRKILLTHHPLRVSLRASALCTRSSHLSQQTVTISPDSVLCLACERRFLLMKFAEKYEILELAASGRVSAFLARDRATQEPVVVYTFECSGASELSTASIIARFCSLAPNPPGIIVKAGFDESSSSAFLTTRMPEAPALQEWVRAYHSFAKPASQPAPEPAGAPASDATAELSAADLKAMLSQAGRPQYPSPAADQGDSTGAFSVGPPSTSPPSGGEFTRLFREANAFEPLRSGGLPPSPKAGNATDALAKPSAPAFPTDYNSPSAPPIAPTLASTSTGSSPGSFTREFLSMSADEAETAKGKNRSATPLAPPTTPPATKEPGVFTREFLAVSQPPAEDKSERDASRTANRAPAAPSATGSISGPLSSGSSPSRPTPRSGSGPTPSTGPTTNPGTNMFSSVFGPGSLPSGPPAPQSPAPESQKPGGGEFTQFFGNPFSQPGPPTEKSIDIPDLAPPAPPKQETGDFTRMFGRDDVASAGHSSQATEDEHPVGGTFTQLFNTPGKGGAQLGSSTLDTHPDLRQSGPASSPFESTPPAPPKPQQTPVLPPLDLFPPRSTAVPPLSPRSVAPEPVMPDPVPNLDRASLGRSSSGGATDFFKVRGADAAPVEEIPSGPSEFTVFISRSQVAASLPPDAPAGAGQPAAPLPFQFAPPPPPPPPAVKLPPAPAPPPLPKPAGAPAKAASYWPLITVLTALVAIAAMLIMYFALTKH